MTDTIAVATAPKVARLLLGLTTFVALLPVLLLVVPARHAAHIVGSTPRRPG